MQSLHDLQKTFSNAILEQDSSQVTHSLDSKKVPIEDAFQIYINNVNLGLCEILSHYFPAIWSLLGEECAFGFATRFIKFYPPEIKNFEDWPAEFPKFLNEQSELKNLPYLMDAGVLEWLQSCSYNAKNQTALTPSEISSFIAKSENENFYIVLDASFSLAQFQYEAHVIVKTALNEASDEIEISPSIYFYTISRINKKVHIECVDEKKFLFLKALNTQTLIEASQTANLSEDEQFQILSSLIKNNHIINLKEAYT